MMAGELLSGTSSFLQWLSGWVTLWAACEGFAAPSPALSALTEASQGPSALPRTRSLLGKNRRGRSAFRPQLLTAAQHAPGLRLREEGAWPRGGGRKGRRSGCLWNGGHGPEASSCSAGTSSAWNRTEPVCRSRTRPAPAPRARLFLLARRLEAHVLHPGPSLACVQSLRFPPRQRKERASGEQGLDGRALVSFGYGLHETGLNAWKRSPQGRSRRPFQPP